MASDRTERRLAAIMFTDIVGYTALMAESEAKGLRVRTRHRQVVRPLVDRYHGEWVESPGDQSLSTFPTALDGVSCGLSILAALRDDPELKLHVGIHSGDIVVRDGEISGDGVNIAARLCSLSDGTGVCVSGEVYRSIRNQPEIEAVALGDQELKNVPEPVAVYSVTGTAAAPRQVSRAAREARPGVRWAAALGALVLIALAMGWWQYGAVSSTGPIRSIAVLPLENLSGDPEQEYFADGMTEALIADLAKVGSLSVISRTSVARYKHSDKSLPEIAKELGVDGVIEGTVIREGDHVRITTQLIDARSDTHVWAERYDRELRGVLALHADVARAVAEQIRLELTPEEQGTLTVSRPVEPAAYDTYLRGVQLRGPAVQVGGSAGWGPRAIEQFERAVELDPEFAEAWEALAVARLVLGIIGWNLAYRSEFPKAREAAERALELDERMGGAHAALGLVRLWYDWDFSGARDSFARAWELSPNDPAVLDAYANQLLREGRIEEALDVSDRLLRVAPFDLFWRAQRVSHLYTAREYQRALEEFERVRELAPSYFDTIVWLTYIALDRFEEAHLASMASAKKCGAPCDWAREAHERGWAEGGWEGSQRAYLDVATTIDGFSPVAIATLYSLLGETDEALVWLERGYRERDPLMVTLRTGAFLDPLRSDPRFRDLLRRIDSAPMLVSRVHAHGDGLDSLLACYLFEGNANDESGNGRHGTVFGATSTAGFDGSAYSFDGVDDFIRAPVDINASVHPKITIGAWANAASVEATPGARGPVHQVISHGDGGFDRGVATDYRVGSTTTSSRHWAAFAGSAGVVDGPAVTIGAWTFIAAVYDQPMGTVTLYVDDTIKSASANPWRGQSFIHIGHNPHPLFENHFHGAIDNVFIYADALSPAEIASIRENGRPPLCDARH